MRAFAFALSCILLAPATAGAQAFRPSPSGIMVTDCNPHLHTAAEEHPWVDPYGNWHYNPTGFPSWDAFLAIAYKNESAQPATEIDFGLAFRGSLVAVVKDVGTFQPGLEIDHEFAISREIFPIASKPECAVLRVKYADGSVWNNPDPPQP
ncbi:MAG TPA: hypothetical protein VMH02_13045 [Verrucomicrobiae bacterium]|nr:hypothetical protein [Verrucomicrobiae bacterium]